jgi:hypothetical protein
MMEQDAKKRRPRGSSAWGSFDAAKDCAKASEEARLIASKMKSALLREARLNKGDQKGHSA